MNKILFVLALSTLPACAGGRLDPRVAPVVGILDVATCEVVSVFYRGSAVGSVCLAAARVVNAILASLSASSARDRGAPPGVASARVRGSMGQLPIRWGGHTIGHLREDLVPEVQAHLDARSPAPARPRAP